MSGLESYQLGLGDDEDAEVPTLVRSKVSDHYHINVYDMRPDTETVSKTVSRYCGQRWRTALCPARSTGRGQEVV